MRYSRDSMYTEHSAKHIALLASGTRGDVQPYIALAVGLRSRGYAANVVAHQQYTPLLAAYGMPWVPLAAGPNALLSQPAYQDALSVAGGVLRGTVSTARFLAAARPAMAAMLESAWRSCRTADALVLGLPTAWGTQIAEALSIPYVWALLQPLGRTGTFASPLLPFPVPPAGMARRASHTLADTLLWLPWRAVLNRWRTRTLGLPPLRVAGPPGPATDPHALALYGYSRHLAPRPADWSANRRVCGSWLPGPPPGWHPDAELAAWCAETPAVYVGFGSMGREEATRLAQLVQAAVAPLGLRALVQAGTACVLLDATGLHERTYTELPHQWLFPQMAAVVHHGGASTTAAATQAGVPQVVVPHAVDQFFWGERATACGVAPVPLPRNQLSSATLTARLTIALRPAMRTRAAELARLTQQEDGVTQAVAAIQQWL